MGGAAALGHSSEAKQAKFEPEPAQMEAPQKAVLEAGEGGPPRGPRAEMRTLNVNRET